MWVFHQKLSKLKNFSLLSVIYDTAEQSSVKQRSASAIYMYGCRQVCFQLNYTSSTEKTRPRGGTKESAEIPSNAMQLSSSLTTGKNKRQCRVGRRTGKPKQTTNNKCFSFTFPAKSYIARVQRQIRGNWLTLGRTRNMCGGL